MNNCTVLIILACTIEPSQTLVKVTVGRQNGILCTRHSRMVLKELNYQALTWMTGTHYDDVHKYDFKLVLEMHT